MVSGEKLRKRKRADLNSPIAYVFHGTYLRNFESILRGGMDPEKRKFDYDYFSLEPEYSLDWCTDTTRSLTGQEDEGDLLVFLVLKLPPGFVCWDGEESFVQMEKVEYELPIAVATLRKVRARV